MDDKTLYGYTLDEHEYRVTVPKMYALNSEIIAMSDPEPEIVIAISAHGGGTVGKEYAQNGWDYVVYVNGREVISGQDLRSGAPATHASMARTLCSFLAHDAELLRYRSAGELVVNYDSDAQAFLETEDERLSLFTFDYE